VNEERPTHVFLIGASAGGLEALSELLRNVDRSRRAAYVVSLHLSPEYPSMMGHILSRRTTLDVETVSGKMDLRAGCIYVLGPREYLSLAEDTVEANPAPLPHPPSVIDRLFLSAASSWGPRATGILLSGTGHDGRDGAEALLAAGGQVWCQSPAEAKFPGMARAAISSRIATFVGTCTEMAAAITAGTQDPAAVPRSNPQELPAFWQLLDVLRHELGLDLFAYRPVTLYRRLVQRSKSVHSHGLQAYMEQAIEDAGERAELSRRLFVGTTEFFRDAAVFDTIRNHVIPTLVDRKSLRIWSVGCSTGQEPYSIAALFDHDLRAAGSMAQLRVFATDVQKEAITRASTGIYTDDQMLAFPDELRDQYFDAQGGNWHVKDALRKKILFTTHDILRDPPFTNIDLLLFRNVLIYLRQPALEQAVSRLHFALRDSGLLALGAGESPDAIGDGFAPLRGVSVPLLTKVGKSKPQSLALRPNPPRTSAPRAPPAETIGLIATRKFMELAGPPAVVLDSAGNVAHILRDPTPYLSLSDGPMTLRAESLTNSQLGSVISAGLARLRRTGQSVSLVSGDLGALPPVEVRLIPLEDGQDHILLVFAPTSPRQVSSDEVASLHEELADARRSLEESLLDLRIANEDLESTNEEMLATNEELEATNEELQATNEELFTVNSERERQIVELTALREDLEAMFAQAELGGVFLDHTGVITRVLGTVRTLLPVQSADVGRNIGEFNANAPDLDLAGLAAQAWASRTVVRESVRLPDGRRITLQVHPVEMSGTPARAMVLFIDESRLDRAKRETDRLLDALPQTIAVLDPSGNISYTNSGWRRFADDNGLPSHPWTGTNYLEAIDPSEPTAARGAEIIRSVLRRKDAEGKLLYPCHSETEERWFAMEVAPVKEGGVVVSHYDVSATHKQLRESERATHRLTAALDAVSCGALTIDAEANIVHASVAALASLGRSATDLEGSSLRLIMTPTSLQRFQPLFDASLHSELPLELLKADGSRHAARLLPSVSDDATRLVLLQSQDSLAPLSMDTMTTLAGGVAHELNNAMAPLAAYLEAWDKDERVPDAVRAELNQARTALAHGKTITTNLLRFARVDAINGGPTAVDAVIEHVLTLVRAGRPSRVRVTAAPASGAYVAADASQLAHALLNLTLNAMDACSPAGTVMLSAKTDDTAELPLRITVRDNGRGMDAEVRDRIFEPFFTTKRASGGTGLGLSLVRTFVSSLDGTIQCDSVPGVGTTFELHLPVVPAPREASRAAPHLASLEGLRGLVVDDDELVRTSVVRLLQACGAAAEPAESGEHALELLGNHDFALLDVMMPGLGGPEVLTILRQTHPQLPVVLLTGDPARIPETQASPNTQFVLKPATREELLHGLQAAGLRHAASSTTG
jgi:two-component system CheB/CheR fusion protein